MIFFRTGIMANGGMARVALVLFLLFSATGTSPPAIFGSATSLTDNGSGATQIFHIGMLLAAAVIFVAGRNRDNGPALGASFVLALLWILLSFAWSQFPAQALRRIAVTFVMIATAWMLVAANGRKRTIDTLCLTLAGIVVLDLIAVAFLPDATAAPLNEIPGYGVGAGWRGLQTDKNEAGPLAAICVICSCYKAIEPGARQLDRTAWVLAAGLAALLLWGSGSKTSDVLLPLSVVLAMAFPTLAIIRPLGCLAVIGAALVAVIAWAASPSVQDRATHWWADMLADPSSFTGRSQIWRMVLHYAARRPWTGYGFGSFWQVGDAGPVFEYATGYFRWIRGMPHSHNGYLDLVIQIGVIGLVLGILAAIAAPLTKLVLYRDMPNITRWLCGTITVFFALHNLLESTLFARDRNLWVLQIINVLIVSTFRPRRIKSGV